jgi:predicted tellurium resistance membrane protein TerC
MHWLTDPQAWIALVTLTAMEIVLGIDNIIFISILVGKLPRPRQARGRVVGLSLAMVTRILLLLSIAWIMKLTQPLFGVLGREFSGRDIILLTGGLFLLAKSVHEIHDKLEGDELEGDELEGSDSEGHGGRRGGVSFASVITQIAILDIVFSLDSVITAVGMAKHVQVMIIAIVIAVGVMMWAAKPIGDFVHRHPTVKMLALSFLLLIGVMLVAEGLGQHISRGYVYFAMAFAFFVEIMNLRLRKKEARPGGEIV